MSAVALLGGILIAMTGLYAYLAVFDWHLIWIVEYPDLLKIGLVIIAILSASGALVSDMFLHMYRATKLKQRWPLVMVFVLAVLFAGLAMYLDKSHTDYFKYFQPLLWLVMLSFCAWSIMSFVEGLAELPIGWVLYRFVTVLISVALFGTLYGFKIKNSEGYKQHVSTKNFDFRSVGLVMITSRYVVLYDRDHTVVVPVGDVSLIEGQPEPSVNK